MSRKDENSGCKRKRLQRDNLEIDGTAALGFGGTQPSREVKKLDVRGNEIPDYSMLSPDSILFQKDPLGIEKYQRDLNAGRLRIPTRGKPWSEWEVMKPAGVRLSVFTHTSENLWKTGLPYYTPLDENGLPIRRGAEVESDDEAVLNSDGEDREIEVLEKDSASSTDLASAASRSLDVLEAAKGLVLLSQSNSTPHEDPKTTPGLAASCHTSMDSSESDDIDQMSMAGSDWAATAEGYAPEFEASSSLQPVVSSLRQTQSQVLPSEGDMSDVENSSFGGNGDPEDLTSRYRNGTGWSKEEEDMMILLRSRTLGKVWPWDKVGEVIGRTGSCRRRHYYQHFDKNTPLHHAKWSDHDQKKLLECHSKEWTWEAIAKAGVLLVKRTVLECQLQYRLLVHPNYRAQKEVLVDNSL